MTNLEGIVRPFQNPDVFPAPFNKQGEQGAQMVRVAIGFQGAVKTMGFSFSYTASSKMGQAHKEKPPENSAALQRRLSEAAGS